MKQTTPKQPLEDSLFFGSNNQGDVITYSVSCEGVVTSYWQGVSELKQILDDYGYLYIEIKVGGKPTKFRVHRLVAKYYLPPKPTPKHQIRHLDGDKLNNRFTNLKWGSAKENAEDRAKHGKTAKGHQIGKKLTAEMVKKIRTEREGGAKQMALAKKYNISRCHISAIVNNRYWKHLN